MVKLNKDQQEAFRLMAQGKNIFITGPGGCGKTALLKIFIKYYKHKKKIGVTSTTGTSSLLINGTTLHSYTGIGLGNASFEGLITRIMSSKSWPLAFNNYKRWLNTDILIIDEVSMLSAELFDKLEKIARTIRENNQPFGGIQLILSGDFCQLPCIDTNKFCFEAESWSKSIQHTKYLNEIIRQNDKNFQKCLNEVRLGEMSETTIQTLKSRINKKLSNQFGISPTILYPFNRSVDYLNNQELDKLSKQTGILFEYNLEFTTYNKNTQKQAEKHKKFCPAVEKLMLTEGCQVMLIYNLDIENKLVNGSRGIVTKFIEDLPVVKFLNGHEKIIDFHIWELEENDRKIGRVIQLPLKISICFLVFIKVREQVWIM